MKLDPRERALALEDAAKRGANDWLLDGEDGHVAALARSVRLARHTAPPGAARVQVDASKTVLATWEFVGYLPEGSANRISRIFKRGDGSLLGVVEWDFAADGGAIYTMPGMNNGRIAGGDATLGGVRGPSGCIASALSWFDARMSYSLELSGPLDLTQQRALLTAVAESLAAARRTSR